MKLKPKEKLIASSFTLFSQDGFHATGVDAILAEAKVAKTTLYRHFHSKDELIVAVLRQRDTDFRNWLKRTVDSSSLESEEKLYLLFDSYRLWAEQPNFNGCSFIKASMEYPDSASSIHAAAASHKQAMTRYIKALVAGCVKGDEDIDLISAQLMLLIDGATVSAQMHKDPKAFDKAKIAAQRLLRSYSSEV